MEIDYPRISKMKSCWSLKLSRYYTFAFSLVVFSSFAQSVAPKTEPPGLYNESANYLFPIEPGTPNSLAGTMGELRSNHFHSTDSELRSNNIRIQLLEGTAYKNDEQLDLTAGEYKLLRLFMENPDRVLSPEQILSRLWDCNENFVDSNTLTVYVRRLRKKIEDDPDNPKRIITVRRMGYRWNSAD